ncbi:HD domain-containing protein [Candidatus Micrarchaeota archaeon]|nr:HD domain-containing protein [Candidatus Micrarchaeota archaeon]
MKVFDRVYSKSIITEPPVIELIESYPLQRLKGIRQYGLPPQFYHNHSFSRHEHSVGVFLLLRKLGAALEEQVAGLLHDISHTAFSHLTDAVLGNAPDSDVQDARHKGFLLSSEVAGILSRHKIKPERIANLDNFPLLERDAPELCADRVDYTLREFATRKDRPHPNLFLDQIAVHKGKIVFTEHDAAKSFALNYLSSMADEWAGIDKTVRQHLFASALRVAVEDNVISIEDLFEDDEHVLGKIASTRHPAIRATLSLLSQDFSLEENEKDPDFDIPRHFRYVDPGYLSRGKIKQLSKTDRDFRDIVKMRKNRHGQGVRVKIVGKHEIINKIAS